MISDHNICLKHPRGLSLLELLLALSITAMVGAAIAGMLGAVSSGVGARRDTRAVMVLANAAQARLAAYIMPSRCVLSVDGPNPVLWFNDNRESDTVHATELRWLIFDAKTGTLNVHYVDLPSSWTQIGRDLEDHEYPLGTPWNSVLAEYQAKGWTASCTLVDGLASAAIKTDSKAALNVRHIVYELGFNTEAGEVRMNAASTIRELRTPVQ